MNGVDRLIILVSDRRRLAARLGKPSQESIPLLVAQFEAAAQAGIPMAILRELDLDARELVLLARQLLARVQATPMRVLVSDRLDVALAAGAHGVHLREQSIATADARSLVPEGFLLGRSVHDPRGARQAGPVDYLLAGTMFPTASKPGMETPLGRDGLASIVSAALVPVAAIGGIETEWHLAQVWTAGAAGFAAISAFQPSSPDPDLVTAVQNCAERMRSGFDLSWGVS